MMGRDRKRDWSAEIQDDDGRSLREREGGRKGKEGNKAKMHDCAWGVEAGPDFLVSECDSQEVVPLQLEPAMGLS